jgi:hypothetical protein
MPWQENSTLHIQKKDRYDFKISILILQLIFNLNSISNTGDRKELYFVIGPIAVHYFHITVPLKLESSDRSTNAAVNVNYVPLWSDTRHLFDTWEKIEGQNSTLFHQGLNIISPGTHFSLRFEGLVTIFPCCERKARYSTPVFFFFFAFDFRHQCYWLQINIIHVELVLRTFLETNMAISFQ